MSRLRFAFVLVAIAALATALAACGGGGGGGSSEKPQEVLKGATFKGIHSANLGLTLHVDAKGEKGGTLDVSLNGPFQSEAGQEFPELDMTAKANGSINGENVDFEGGLVLLPNSAYVNYKGTDYEVDPTTFSFVKSMIEKAANKQEGQQSPAESNACKEAASNLKLSDFIENLTNEGSSDVGGTSTTKVSGDLNVPGAIEAGIKLIENPACNSQLGSLGAFPSKAEIDAGKAEIESALKKSHVEVEVGEDKIVRRVAGQLTIEPKKSGEGPKSVEIEFDLSLNDVNKEQSIEAPKGAKPLNELFEKLGINPLELLKGFEQGGGGAGGLNNLLEGLGGASGGSSGGSSGGQAPGGGGQQAYLNCVQSARTPSDLQKCSELLQ